MILATGFFFYDENKNINTGDYNPNAPSIYTSTGKFTGKPIVWVGRVSVTDASAQTVDISSAGFTVILATNVQPENNTTSATSMPTMSVKSCTTTTLTFNTLVSNSGALGILAGLIAPTSLTGMYASVVVFGY